MPVDFILAKMELATDQTRSWETLPSTNVLRSYGLCLLPWSDEQRPILPVWPYTLRGEQRLTSNDTGPTNSKLCAGHDMDHWETQQTSSMVCSIGHPLFKNQWYFDHGNCVSLQSPNISVTLFLLSIASASFLKTSARNRRNAVSIRSLLSGSRVMVLPADPLPVRRPVSPPMKSPPKPKKVYAATSPRVEGLM